MRKNLIALILAVFIGLFGLAVLPTSAHADPTDEKITLGGYDGVARVYPEWTTGERYSVSLVPVSSTYVQYISHTRIYITARSYRYQGYSTCHTAPRLSDPPNIDNIIIIAFDDPGC